MMCHSVEVARFLLTAPGADRNSLTLRSANGTVANLKWTRPEYVQRLQAMMGPEVDYSSRPAEDFARGTPVLEDEAGIYGYTDENRHMVEAFRAGKRPMETFADGVAVMEMLMALYRSAELGQTVQLPAPELEDYVPPVARAASGG